MSGYKTISIGVMLLLLMVVLLALVMPSYYRGLLTLVVIYALFGMSLDILTGYAGLPSLGHAAFFGVGGYAIGILEVKYAGGLGISFWITFGVGLVAAGIFAALFGAIANRAKTHYFLLITLALSQMLMSFATKGGDLTGGSDGFGGIPRPEIGLAGVSLDSSMAYFLFVLAVVAVSSLVLYLVVSSPFGWVLRGIRENETRMLTLGYQTWRYKYMAFVVAGVFGGVAGILRAYYFGYVGPGDLGVPLSMEALLIVMLGGAGTLFGSVIGATVVVVIVNVVGIYTGRWTLVLGAAYIATVLFWPKGLIYPLKRLVKATTLFRGEDAEDGPHRRGGGSVVS